MHVAPQEAMVCCFFFQAEDGIRDYKVTGVQTCALPILAERDQFAHDLTAARRWAAVAQLDGPAPELDRARVQWAGPLRQLIRWSPDPAGERSRLAVARLGLRQRQCRDQQSDPHVLTPEV